MKKIIFLATIVIAIVAVLSLTTKPVNAAKSTCDTIQGGTLVDAKGNPISLGYDKWGYNYQANMFNGLYDNYSRPDLLATSGDRLMMKWNDAWLSNKDCDGDGKLDRHYGFTSYIGSGAWLTNHISGSYVNETDTWNVVGTWKWLVLSTYEHDLVITSQNPDGTFLGTGGYPAGSSPYTAAGQTPETITGQITGDQITFTTTYAGPYNPGYSVTVTGTINPDGTITGIGPWEWHSTLGNAVKNICTWNEFYKIVAVPDDAVLTAGVWYAADGKEIGPVIWNEFAIIQDVYNNSCTGDHGVLYKSPAGPGLSKY